MRTKLTLSILAGSLLLIGFLASPIDLPNSNQRSTGALKIASTSSMNTSFVQSTFQLQINQQLGSAGICTEVAQGTLECDLKVGELYILNAQASIEPASLVTLKATGPFGSGLPDNSLCLPLTFPFPCNVSGQGSVSLVFQFTPDETQITDPNAPIEIDFQALFGAEQQNQLQGKVFINVVSAGEPDIVVNPTSIDFGLVETGTSHQRSIVIRNEGDADLTINSIRLAQTNSPFNLGGNSFTAFTLTPGSSRTIEVFFSPNQVGEFANQLNISSDDPDEANINVQLQGAAGEPDIEVEPSSVDFGFVEVGTRGTSDFTISNAGQLDLEITSIRVGGSEPFSIAEGEPQNFVLSPGASRTIEMIFEPTAVGEEIDNLFIDSNDPDASTTFLPVVGEGVEPTPPPPPPPSSDCTIRIEGKVEESFKGYPISDTKVFFYTIADSNLPIPPLSRSRIEPEFEGSSLVGESTDFDGIDFTTTNEAHFDFNRIFPLGDTADPCPPRMIVVAFLWQDENIFAVTTDNLIGDRYVPLYLARCISIFPEDEDCEPWDLAAPNTYVAQADFIFGSTPTAEQSAKIIGTAAFPSASEEWKPHDGDFEKLMERGAHTYFYSFQAMQYFLGLEIVDLSPVIVTVDSKEPTSADEKPNHSFGDVGENESPNHPDAIVYVNEDDSSPDDNKKPDNREWHELGHYWMIELYGGNYPLPPEPFDMDFDEPCDTGLRGPPFVIPEDLSSEEDEIPIDNQWNGNHCGYANETTNDSLIEGFAEFTSMVIAKHYGDPKPWLYRWEGNNTNLEIDRRIWGPHAALFNQDGLMLGFRTFDATDEEFAIAGLLWDLHDGGDFTFDNIREVKALGVISNEIQTEDLIEIPAKEIFETLHFGTPQPRTLKQVQDSFFDAFKQNSDEAETNDIFSDVDEVFIAHGAFNDDNPRNLKHDAGEAVGSTGSTSFPNRPVRHNVSIDPNSILLSRFLDNNGNVIAFADIKLFVEIKFEAPFEYYDFEYAITPISLEVFIKLPPNYYPSTATITATTLDGLSSVPFTLNSDLYWLLIDLDARAIAEHVFVLE